MNAHMNAGSLYDSHIGRRVKVSQKGLEVTSVVTGIAHSDAITMIEMEHGLRFTVPSNQWVTVVSDET